MATKILMIKDVEKARSGDIVSVRPGYSRYLLEHGFAVRADKGALRMQERLKEEITRLRHEWLLAERG